MKKIRTRIPQENKVRAVLQQEINSRCPFYMSIEVGHFEIHHIDENPSNNEISNLLLLSPTCHFKITKKDIQNDEVFKIKKSIGNSNSSIKFISASIDSENCGWEPIKDTPNSFGAIRLKYLYPKFNFSFINHSDKTVLLTNAELESKQMPVGLSGPYVPLPNILRPSIKYKIEMPQKNGTVNPRIVNELQVPQGLAFKFQIELFSESMEVFKPQCKYALRFKFGFNNDFYINIPVILLNTEKEYDKLQFHGLA